jgi:hypothetical protein
MADAKFSAAENIFVLIVRSPWLSAGGNPAQATPYDTSRTHPEKPRRCYWFSELSAKPTRSAVGEQVLNNAAHAKFRAASIETQRALWLMHEYRELFSWRRLAMQLIAAKQLTPKIIVIRLFTLFTRATPFAIAGVEARRESSPLAIVVARSISRGCNWIR